MSGTDSKPEGVEPRDGEDLRADERQALVLKVEYPSMDGFLQDYTANISRGGTMIYSQRQVAEGRELQLVISFPGLLRPIRLTGTVRWVRQEGAEVAFGVEFSRDPNSGWRMLDELVNRIASRDPRLVAQNTLCVLLVEDNAHMAHLIRRGLETHVWRSTDGLAFSIHHAEHGMAALERLKTNRYDILLVDALMPVMDGETLIREIRSLEHWRNVPIIAFSAADETVRTRVLGAGADLFLPKPLRLEVLLETMRRLASIGTDKQQQNSTSSSDENEPE